MTEAVKFMLLRCISKEVYPSPATGGYHQGGIPFDTGALLSSINVQWRDDGVDISIGEGIPYNEWLNESSYTRHQWIRIMTKHIADNIYAAMANTYKTDGSMTEEEVN